MVRKGGVEMSIREQFNRVASLIKDAGLLSKVEFELNDIETFIWEHEEEPIVPSEQLVMNLED
jgi:hypothetical protein